MKRLPDTELEVMKALWATGANTPRTLLEEKLAHFEIGRASCRERV